MHAPAVVTAAGALFICAACGSAGMTQPSRPWRSNALQLVEQLRSDVAAVQSVRPSQKAFVDSGELYVLLVAYSDLSGCSSMAAETAAPARIIRVLGQPCPHLERAAALFTQAEHVSDPRILARAVREAALAGPALVRAAAALRIASI
jgi:hypothetical protein